jgi:hypothetical protein
MPISIRKHVRSETLLFVLSGAALVAVFGGGWAVPAPAASSVPSDRLDEVPTIATTPLPGATIDAGEIPSSNVDTLRASNLRQDGTAGPSGAQNGPGEVGVHSISR